MATQISVFVENKPGKIEAITDILFQGGINLRGISIASRGDFGILKILPDNPGKAAGLLEGSGATISRRAVVIALIDDRPGSLHELLKVLRKNSINIDDCYGISVEQDKQAAIVLDIEDNPKTESILRAAGVRLIEDKDIHTL